jgi:hypothetical protein
MGKRAEFLTDAEIEVEIERLVNSEDVKLAKKEQRILYRRRQYCYQLRNMEKRGKELAKQGITMDNIESVLFGEIEEETE